MTKVDFRMLFCRVLNMAADKADAKMDKPISRSFLINLHAFGKDNRLMPIDKTVNMIYLGSERFYRIIDVGIEEVLPSESVAFVRVSGHAPDAFGATWDPSGLGPFKHMLFDKIVDRRVHSG